MKVKELITELQKYDGESEVRVGESVDVISKVEVEEVETDEREEGEVVKAKIVFLD